MKKQVLFFVALIFLLFTEISGQAVYITKTGEKYHEQNCRYLKKSSIPINLSDAIKRGYGSCAVCNPPTSSSSVTDKQNNSRTRSVQDSSSNKNNSNETSSQQCTSKTKSGSRCKRMTKSSNGFCWQHGGN